MNSSANSGDLRPHAHEHYLLSLLWNRGCIAGVAGMGASHPAEAVGESIRSSLFGAIWTAARHVLRPYPAGFIARGYRLPSLTRLARISPPRKEAAPPRRLTLPSRSA